MVDQSAPDQALLRSRLEFPVWHVAFARSYAAWSNAPSDLKGPLLLSGPALTKAESWLVACPERLSDSEKRFIVRSIAQRAREPNPKPLAKRRGSVRRRIGWQRQSDRSLWQLLAVIIVGLWVFAPDFIKQTMEQAINSPDANQDLKSGPIVVATPNAKDDPETSTTHTPTPARGAGVTARPSDGVETEPAVPPMPEPPPPPQSRAVRLAELAREQLDAGQPRQGLLLAVEATEVTRNDTTATQQESALATAVLLRAMGSRTQLAALTTSGRPAATALFCDGAKGIVAATADATLSAWTLASADRRTNLGEWRGPLDGVSVDRDCRRMIVGDEDFNAAIRPLDGGKPIAVLTGHEATILASAFGPDGQTVATASQDNNARLWDARTGRLRAVLSGHDWQVTSIAYSNDSRRVITASSDMTARIWDVVSGRLLHTLGRHQGIVTSAAFSTDGAMALTTSWDGIARLWDTASGDLVRSFKGEGGSIQNAWLSSDGRRIAAVTDRSAIYLWDAETGLQIGEIAAASQKAKSAIFVPDSRWVATLSWDGKVVLHDADTGNAVATLNGNADRVQALAFGHGSTTAVAITIAGARLTWPLFGTTTEALTQAKVIAPSCLPPDERTLLGLEAEQPGWCKDLPTRGAVLPQ